MNLYLPHEESYVAIGQWNIPASTVFTVCTTISIFVIGFMLNRLNDRRKERKRLRDLERFFFTSINLLKEPIESQAQILDGFIESLRRRGNYKYTMERVSAVNFENLRSVSKADLYKILMDVRRGPIDRKIQLYNSLICCIKKAELINENLEQRTRFWGERRKIYRDKWNDGFGAMQDAFQRHIVDVVTGKTNDALTAEYIKIRNEWKSGDMKDVEYAKTMFIDRVLELCNKFMKDPRVKEMFTAIATCMNAYQSMNEINELTADQFESDAKGLREGNKGMQEVVGEFKRLKWKLF